MYSQNEIPEIADRILFKHNQDSYKKKVVFIKQALGWWQPQ